MAANSLVTDLALVVLFAELVALTAQISIPLSFTPVPITGQTLGVLLAGSALGGRRGAISMLVYLVMGGAGLHAFAGGAAGWWKFVGPTGGYLISYPLAAGIVGKLAEQGWDRTPKLTACSMLIGSFVIYASGVIWLSFYVGGIGPAILKGMVPFLPGDLIKLLLAAMLLPGVWALERRIRRDGLESQ